MTNKKKVIDANFFINDNESEKLNNHKEWEKIPNTYYKKYIGNIDITHKITKKTM